MHTPLPTIAVVLARRSAALLLALAATSVIAADPASNSAKLVEVVAQTYPTRPV